MQRPVVRMELPQEAKDLGLEGAKEVVNALLWAHVVEVLPRAERDASLYVLLKSVQDDVMRCDVLRHVLRRVNSVDRYDLPLGWMRKAAEDRTQSDLKREIESWWRQSTPDRPRFLVVASTRDVDNLVPFDGPGTREGVTQQVDHVLDRVIRNFYGYEEDAPGKPHGEKKDAPGEPHGEQYVAEEINRIVFGDVLTEVRRDVSPRHRVMALSWVLWDQRFPIYDDWRTRFSLDKYTDADYALQSGRYAVISESSREWVAGLCALYVGALPRNSSLWAAVLRMLDALLSSTSPNRNETTLVERLSMIDRRLQGPFPRDGERPDVAADDSLRAQVALVLLSELSVALSKVSGHANLDKALRASR